MHYKEDEGDQLIQEKSPHFFIVFTLTKLWLNELGMGGGRAKKWIQLGGLEEGVEIKKEGIGGAK